MASYLSSLPATSALLGLLVMPIAVHADAIACAARAAGISVSISSRHAPCTYPPLPSFSFKLPGSTPILSAMISTTLSVIGVPAASQLLQCHAPVGTSFRLAQTLCHASLHLSHLTPASESATLHLAHTGSPSSPADVRPLPPHPAAITSTSSTKLVASASYPR